MPQVPLRPLECRSLSDKLAAMHSGGLRIGLGCLALVTTGWAQSTWVGREFDGSFTSAGNWRDAAVPANDGSAVVVLGGPALDHKIVLPTNFAVASIQLSGTETVNAAGAAGGSTLTLGADGIQGSSATGGWLEIAANVTLQLAGPTTFSAAPDSGSTFVLSGPIVGTGPLTLANGAFLINRTDGANAYTGGTLLRSTGSAEGHYGPTVTIWHSNALGTGLIEIEKSASLYAYNPTAPSSGTGLDNDLTFNSSASATAPTVTLRAADTSLVLNGAVTLAGDTLLRANAMSASWRSDSGYIPLPGPAQRNPVVFTGPVAETGGARKLSVQGTSYILLTGSSTFTGGIEVGTASTSGALVFGSVNALPATGSLALGNAGYVGVTDAAQLSTLLTRLGSTTTQGAIGLDTAPGAGSTTTLASGTFDFASTPNLRLGTATTAVIGSGVTLTPAGTNPYQFGNGGGTLYVQAPLTGTRGLSLSSGSLLAPLRLVLQGANDFTGAVTVHSGQLVFDSALPGTGQTLSLSGSSGYIGVTENAAVTPAAFLARFAAPASLVGTVGFDSANAANPRAVTDAIDLSAFGASTFLGTSSAVTLSGPITPSAADSTYRFTAARDGTLTVASDLAAHPLVVGLATASDQPANGTVVLAGTNAHTSTALAGSYLTLEAEDAAALGTGPLSLTGTAGFQSGTGGATFANAFNFASGAILVPSGSNAFTLSGSLTSTSGTGGTLRLANSNNLHVTLSGDNSAWNGAVLIDEGVLILARDRATGSSWVQLQFADAVLKVTESTTIQGLDAVAGSSVRLADGVTLTLDTTDPDDKRGTDLDARITAIDGTSATNAALVVTATLEQERHAALLTGQNLYTGGTTVTGAALLGLAHADAAGTGTITLNAAQGGLIVAPNVTLSNKLDFQQGALAGGGTFAVKDPTGGLTVTTYDFSQNRGVAPGYPDIADLAADTLTLAGSATFGDGGYYIWSLQDAAASDGASQLALTGALSLTATSGLFTLQLQSFDNDGDPGTAANFDSSQTYQWVLVTAPGGITGLSGFNYTVDTGKFYNCTEGGGFSLSQSGHQLLLNFTPVPEPSTYALLALGLGAVWITARRRRASR